MTAAVRALLTPFYWLAVVIVFLAAMPLLIAPLSALHGWQADLGGVAAGMVVPGLAVLAKGPILDRLAARIAVRIENLAAEWREITAAPTLPPTGGTPTDGPAGPSPERLHP
jgi:hypothetical protein